MSQLAGCRPRVINGKLKTQEGRKMAMNEYSLADIAAVADGAGSRGGGRSGWQNQYGSGRSRGGRRGYDGMSYYHDPMESVRAYMRGANPQEQERIRAEMRSMADGSM